MITITNEEFRLLAEFIHTRTGIHLKEEKQSLLSGRLQNTLQERGMSSFSEYYHFLKRNANGNEIALLVDKITTNHTFFMRETGHFTFFQSKVLPDLIRAGGQRDLRVWSAGCSSGEEPYTLSMIIDEYFGGNKNGWNTQLLATDICNTVLDKARSGEYTAEAIKDIPEHWKTRYFRKNNERHYGVTPHIQKEVLFRRFNLMDEEFPFKRKFHAIFCRNVMIYFDEDTRARLIRKFYELTEPGGYLFIGHSESLNRERTPYQYVMPSVYRK